MTQSAFFSTLTFKDNLNEFLRCYNILGSDTILIVSVSDEGSNLWSSIDFPKPIKNNVKKPQFRRPFELVFDFDEGKTISDNEHNILETKVGMHAIVVESHGYGDKAGLGSTIQIDGRKYVFPSPSRGLNILIFSKKHDCVLDCFNVDTFGDPSLIIHRLFNE